MTPTQKKIITLLLAECIIVRYSRRPCRLRTPEGHPLTTFNARTFNTIQPLLRRTKDYNYVIDKRAVQKLNGNTWVKKEYLLKKQYDQKISGAHKM